MIKHIVTGIDEHGNRAREVVEKDGQVRFRKVTSIRAVAVERVSAMAGVTPDGVILPPRGKIVIDRSPKPWWRNRAITSLLLIAILLVSVSCTRIVRAPPLPHLAPVEAPK